MLKIHGAPISVHTRKAIIVARLKNLPYEVIPVVPVIPGNPPANWGELSPTGRIPVLVDGDFTVADSTAICTYLDRLHPEPAVYPKAPRELARALALEAYAGERMFREVVRVLFHETFVHPRVHNQPTDDALVQHTLHHTLPQVFGYLDRAAASGWLAGDALSVADLAVASNLLTFSYLGFDFDRGRYARLAALFERVLAVAAVREVVRAEQPFVESMNLRAEIPARLAA